MKEEKEEKELKEVELQTESEDKMEDILNMEEASMKNENVTERGEG